MNYLRRLFEQGGYSLEQIYDLHSHPQAWYGMCQMWVWEGANGNQRRRDRYPNYKIRRQDPYENIFAIVKEFEGLLACIQGVWQVRVHGYEGDDVIAHLVQRYYDYEISIQSNDKDFRQLYKEGRVNGMANPIADVPDDYVRLYKALVGDPSDNIAGVPGFGEKAWGQCDKSGLRDRFADGDFRVHTGDGIRPKQVEWINSHQDEMAVLWEIVGFYEIPNSVVDKSILIGVHNPELAQQILQPFRF